MGELAVLLFQKVSTLANKENRIGQFVDAKP